MAKPTAVPAVKPSPKVVQTSTTVSEERVVKPDTNAVIKKGPKILQADEKE